MRHRQTKGADTDMFDLQPPRHISTLRISPVAAHSRDRLFSEPIAGTQAWPREMVFMPQAGPPEQFDGSAGTAEMPSIMVYGHTCIENSRFPAACGSELSEGTAACS